MIHWRIRHIMIGIKNLFIFFKTVWDFKHWDYSYNLELFKHSLELTKNYIEKFGFEEDESRLRRVEKMARVIQLIKDFLNNDFYKKAELILNKEIVSRGELEDMDNLLTEKEIKDNDEIRKLAVKLEEEEWNELFLILKGTGNEDGTDMRGWWD